MALPVEFKIGIVAGEHSGDLLGAELMAALKKRLPSLIVEGVAGPNMIAAGCISLFPMERLNIMGFVEPLFRLPELWWRRNALIAHWRRKRPDVVVTIDAPDFNLGLARHLKKHGIKVIHYVSPTVWAWRPKRIYTVAQAVHHLLTLFPFEPACYQSVDLAVTFVGHPLADRLQPIEMAEARRSLGLAAGQKVLAVLPGSRSKEIKLHLPIFLETALLLQERDAKLQVVIAAVDPTKAALIQQLLTKYAIYYPVVIAKTRTVIAASDAVLVVSGTATLETLLERKPMVVAYKTGPWTYWLAKKLIKTNYIALPNILANAPLVPECIQKACTSATLAAALVPLLEQDQTALIAKFLEIKQQLQQGASERAAEVVLKIISPTLRAP